MGAMGNPGTGTSAEYLQVSAGPTSIFLTSKTYTGIHTAVTDLKDGISSGGISRANATFSFLRGGVYILNVRINSISASGFIFLRARRINGTQATLLSGTVFSGGPPVMQPPDGLHGLIQVAANDQIEIQYQVSPTIGTYDGWGFNTGESSVGGDTNRTANISIYSIDFK